MALEGTGARYFPTRESIDVWSQQGDVPLAQRLSRHHREVFGLDHVNQTAYFTIFALLALSHEPKAVLLYQQDQKAEALATEGREAARTIFGRDEVPIPIRTLTVQIGGKRTALVITTADGRIPQEQMVAVARHVGSTEPPLSNKQIKNIKINPDSFSPTDIFGENSGYVSPFPPHSSLGFFDGIYFLPGSPDPDRTLELQVGGGVSVILNQGQFGRALKSHFAQPDDSSLELTVVDITPSE